jgi:hypothetical protein
MNKFVKEDLLNMFSDAARSVKPDISKEDIEPILNRAINNFQTEMHKPIESFEYNTPGDVKAEIFNILLKHFTMCMRNEKIFMEDSNLPEITKRFESLLE